MMNNNLFHNLPIPVYLNQQIVFDLLAIKDDGFSMIRTVKTSSSETNSEDKSIEGGIGINNVFALLGVQFSAQKGQGKHESEVAETEQEKIYTPNSLFAKLRQLLNEGDTIVSLESERGIADIQVGQFVEFNAVLAKAPMISVLENFLELMKLEGLFGSSQAATQKSPKGRKSNSTSNVHVVKQIEGFLRGISSKNSIQLIGNLTASPNIHAVFSAKPDFFLDGDTTEVLDGEFRVLGKLTKVVQEEDDPINLLTATSFSLFDTDTFTQLIQIFENMGNNPSELKLNLPRMEIEISPPAIQLIPIAIFR